MANLAQTYIHLRPFSMTKTEAAEVAGRVQQQIRPVVEHIYRQDVVLDIRFEEGSLKAWFSIAGAIGALYTFVATYKDFKEGVGELCSDAREFGVNVCEIFAAATKVSDNQIYRIEKRLKTPGKLRRLIFKLEKLDEIAGRISNEQLLRELSEVYRILDSVKSDLTEAEHERLLGTFKFKNLAPLNKIPDQILRAPHLAIRNREEFEGYEQDLLEPLMAKPQSLMSENGSIRLLVPALRNEVVYHDVVPIPRAKNDEVD